MEDLFSRAALELDSFYDSLEEMLRSRREASRAELQSLSQSFQQKWSSEEFAEAVEEVKLMKRDIEENVESIIGEVEEETFVQCVESYKERL